MSAERLALLRDIHLPPEPGWWPPALVDGASLGALLAGIAVLLVVRTWRRRRRPTLRDEVRIEMRRLQRAFARQAESRAAVAQVAALLRRAAIARHGREAAGLSGADWAAYLIRHSPPGCDPVLWKLIAVDRYAPAARSVGSQALLEQCRRWLENLLR